jgi:hypothetical protein
MSQVLLKQSQCIARVVQFHRMDAKGIPQTVGANTSYSAGFQVYQVGEISSSGTVSHYLPRPIPVKTEDKLRATATSWVKSLL